MPNTHSKKLDLLPTKKILTPLLAAAFILGGSFLVSNFKKGVVTEALLSNTEDLIYTKENGVSPKNEYRETIREALVSATKGGSQIEGDEETSQKIKKFVFEDVNVTSSDDETALRKYATELRSILKTYSDPEKKSLVGAALDLYETKDMLHSESLAAAEDRTVMATDSLQKMNVPKNLGTYHLALLNDLLISAFYIGNMQIILENPELGLIATEEYSLKMYDIASDLSLINIYMTDKKISFSKEEQTEIFLDLI